MVYGVATNVSTGIALIAFLSAIALAAYRHHLKNRESLIRSLPSAARAEWLDRELNAFGVRAEGLTKEQRFQLALREIELRRARLFLIAGVAAILGAVAGSVAVISTLLAAGRAATNPNMGVGTSEPVLFDRNVEALKEIADTAERICGTAAGKATPQNTQLGGEAKAQLGDLLEKLTDVGVSGAGKYATSSYSGVLQTDIASNISNSQDCKRQIFEILQQKLLPEPLPNSVTSPPSYDRAILSPVKFRKLRSRFHMDEEVAVSPDSPNFQKRVRDIQECFHDSPTGWLTENEKDIIIFQGDEYNLCIDDPGSTYVVGNSSQISGMGWFNAPSGQRVCYRVTHVVKGTLDEICAEPRKSAYVNVEKGDWSCVLSNGRCVSGKQPIAVVRQSRQP